MGGEIAGTVLPFGVRIRARLAVNAVLHGHSLVTTLAGFHNRIAGATVEATTLLAHEKAIGALFDRLTEHVPSLLFFAVFQRLWSIQKKPGHYLLGRKPRRKVVGL